MDLKCGASEFISNSMAKMYLNEKIHFIPLLYVFVRGIHFSVWMSKLEHLLNSSVLSRHAAGHRGQLQFIGGLVDHRMLCVRN